MSAEEEERIAITVKSAASRNSRHFSIGEGSMWKIEENFFHRYLDQNHGYSDLIKSQMDSVLQHLQQLFMESCDKYFPRTYLENINYHKGFFFFFLTKALSRSGQELRLKWGWCGFESQPQPSPDVWPQTGHSPTLSSSYQKECWLKTWYII